MIEYVTPFVLAFNSLFVACSALCGHVGTKFGKYIPSRDRLPLYVIQCLCGLVKLLSLASECYPEESMDVVVQVNARLCEFHTRNALYFNYFAGLVIIIGCALYTVRRRSDASYDVDTDYMDLIDVVLDQFGRELFGDNNTESTPKEVR